MGFPLNLIIWAASTLYQIHQHNQLKKAQDKQKGQFIHVRGQSISLPVVYGKQPVGGAETFHKVSSNYIHATPSTGGTALAKSITSNVTGTKNEFLYMQQALCHEGISSIDYVYVNGKKWDHKDHTKGIRIHTYLDGGTADAMASANGIATTNTFTKTAYASMAFRLDRDKNNYSGIPSVEFHVKGKKVKPVTRSGSSPNYTYALGTAAYSNNPSLILLDYLTNDVYGRGLSTSEVNLGSFYDAAQICDTVVLTNAEVAGRVNGVPPILEYANQAGFPTKGEEGYVYKDLSNGNHFIYNITGGTDEDPTGAYASFTLPTRNIPLYECNLTLNTEDSLRDNVERILRTMGTAAHLIWGGDGRYKLHLEYPTSASETNALINSAHVFTADDIIREEVDINWLSANERYNQATVSFQNEHEDFKSDSVTFPRRGSSVHNTFLTEDNSQPMETSIDSDGVTDPYHALALAEQMVRASRHTYNIGFKAGRRGLTLEPGDFMKLTLPTSGLTNEVFRVSEVKVNEDMTVDVQAYSFTHETLAWNIADGIAYTSPVVVDFEIEPATAVTYNAVTSATQVNGTSSGTVSWTASADSRVYQYIVSLKKGSNAAVDMGTTRGTSFDLSGLASGSYVFSVEAVSSLGVKSAKADSAATTLSRVQADELLVIYGDSANASSNNQSYTFQTGYNFIAYKVNNGDTPSLPITSGITFTRFIGTDGADSTVPGPPGSSGLSTFQATVFKRASSAPSAPSGGTYNFGTSVLTAPTGWSATIPSGTDPIYACNFQFSVSGASGTVTAGTWSTPTLFVQNGDDGADSTVPGPPGAAGIDAYTVGLTANKYAIAYDIDGGESDSITFTAAPQGIQGTATYSFAVDGVTKQSASTSTTYAMADSDEPASGAAKVVSVSMFDDNVLKATDSVSVYGIQSGEDAITVVMTNEAHALPTTSSGTVSYTNSGTDIKVFRGSTPVPYGSGANTFSISTPTDTNITVGSASTVSTNTRRFANASNCTSANASIEFEISVRNSLGTATVFTKVQTFNKTVDGSDGSAGLSTFQATIFKRVSSAPSTPTGGSYNFSTSTLTPPTGWSITVPSGTDPIYACNFQFSVAGTSTVTAGTWSTPIVFVQNGADGADGIDAGNVPFGVEVTLTGDPTTNLSDTVLDAAIVAAPHLSITNANQLSENGTYVIKFAQVDGSGNQIAGKSSLRKRTHGNSPKYSAHGVAIPTNLTVDGNLITAGTITASAVETDFINAFEISASNISAGTLDVDDITVNQTMAFGHEAGISGGGIGVGKLNAISTVDGFFIGKDTSGNESIHFSQQGSGGTTDFKSMKMDTDVFELVNPDIKIGEPTNLEVVYSTVGSHSYSVPSGYDSATITIYGAGGAGGDGTTSGSGDGTRGAQGGSTTVNLNGGSNTTATGGLGGIHGGNVVDGGGTGESSLFGTGGVPNGGNATGNAAGGAGGRNRGSWGGGSGGTGGLKGNVNTVTYSVSQSNSINITITAGGTGAINSGDGTPGYAIISLTGPGTNVSGKVLTENEYNALKYTVPKFIPSSLPTAEYWSVASNIGTYAFCQAKNVSASNLIGERTTSGANLTPSNAHGVADASPTNLSGTWRCMGYQKSQITNFSTSSKTYETTLWLRIL